MRDVLSRFWNVTVGASAIEYSLLAAAIALVIVVAVNGIGATLKPTFTTVQTGLK